MSNQELNKEEQQMDQNATNNPVEGNLIHVVFQEADIKIIESAIAMDASLAGGVILVRDDFAVGPIQNLDNEEGWKAREDWWRELLQGSPYGPQQAGSFDDRDTVEQLKTKLDAEPAKELWLWMGQNQHDVCSYFWLMRQLQQYQGRVMVLYLNNLPFLNEKGQLHYPVAIHQILPKEILKAKRLSRPITLSEFEVDPDEWNRLVSEHGMVRILEGGKKIVSRGADFFDADILKNISNDWQKAWRVLSNTLNHMKIKTGDVYIMWRLKELISSGKVEAMGDTTKSWKEFDVRLAGNADKQNESVDQFSVQQ